jgi:hypothetical protein
VELHAARTASVLALRNDLENRRTEISSLDHQGARGLGAVQQVQSFEMAMLTGSKLVRALMFAFSFVNRATKVVGLDDGDVAFDFLGLDAVRRETARRLRRELESELGLTFKAPASTSASPRG